MIQTLKKSIITTGLISLLAACSPEVTNPVVEEKKVIPATKAKRGMISTNPSLNGIGRKRAQPQRYELRVCADVVDSDRRACWHYLVSEDTFNQVEVGDSYVHKRY